jgi:hypothetical protein
MFQYGEFLLNSLDKEASRVIQLFLILSVQQSSFYGYTSMLPKRYTQAVMTGESKYRNGIRLGLIGPLQTRYKKV